MKAFISLTILLVSFCSCSSGDDTAAKKEELKKVLEDYFTAFSKEDTVTLRSLTTSNFVLFDDGIVYSTETAISALRKRKPFKITTTIDSMNIHMDKKDASAYYFRKADFVFDDTVRMQGKFLESATFNKEGDKWKLRFLHSSFRNPGNMQ